MAVKKLWPILFFSVCGTSGHAGDKRCTAPPFGDTPEAFAIYLQTHFKATGMSEVACQAKFNHVGRQRFYALGIIDEEIDSATTTELAARYTEEIGKQNLQKEAKSLSVPDFVLDGKQLAVHQDAVSISGSYIKRGNMEMLYSDLRSLITDGSDSAQPSVSLLTENATREFRKQLLSCQMNPSTAQLGCSVIVRGYATACVQTNAFGVRREMPCLEVIDGGPIPH